MTLGTAGLSGRRAREAVAAFFEEADRFLWGALEDDLVKGRVVWVQPHRQRVIQIAGVNVDLSG